MKWAMVMVGILVLSMCGSTKSAAPPTGDEPASTTVAEESTTTTASTTTTVPTTTTEPPTTTLPAEVPDLSGVWWGTKTMGGQPEEGTVLISQAGLTFTLSFSDGFECRPADACEFDGTVEVLENDEGETMYVWMASNSGVADDKGGTFETFFGIQPFSAYYDPAVDVPVIDPATGEEKDNSDVYMGVGVSVYRVDGEEMEWEGHLMLKPFG